MIAAFEGWNDAGDAATAAVEQLGLTWDATPLTELDPEGFYDFQVTRPTVRLIDGVTRTIDWPTTRLSACRLTGSPTATSSWCTASSRTSAGGRSATSCSRSPSTTRWPPSSGSARCWPTCRTPGPIQVTGSAHDAGDRRPARPGPVPLRGAHRHLRGVPGRLRAGRHPVAVVLGVRAALRVAGARRPKATLALLHRVEEILDIEVPLGTLPGAGRRSGRPRSPRSPRRTTRSPSTSGPWRSARKRTSRSSRPPASRSPRSSSGTCGAGARAPGRPAAGPDDARMGAGHRRCRRPAGAGALVGRRTRVGCSSGTTRTRWRSGRRRTHAGVAVRPGHRAEDRSRTGCTWTSGRSISDAEVERFLSLGATRVDVGQGERPWVVLADPEGNEFCVLGPRRAANA